MKFRGAHRDTFVVTPIDPSRPHRFVETEVGRAGTCVLCGCKRDCRHDIHSDSAKQRTVQFREGQ
jgi:hypothetical protein